MSHAEDKNALEPTFAEGYKITTKKTVDEYAKLDANDESLNKWKASLGIGATAVSGGTPKIEMESLFLTSATLPAGKSMTLDLRNPQMIAELKNNPITIKEGVEYSVGINFRVSGALITGLRYIHVVKLAGITVDRTEQMIGSFGPLDKTQSSTFLTEESPSGLIARQGTYHVKSRIIDDDKVVHSEFDWAFKIGKEWK